MRKENETGRKLHLRIKQIEADIETLGDDNKRLLNDEIHCIQIFVIGNIRGMKFERDYKIEKENTEMNMNYLNKLIMECFPKAFEKRKEELENEIELLGK